MSETLNGKMIEMLTEKVDAGFEGTHERLDKINGRVGNLEQKSAVLESQKLNSRIVQLETTWNKAIGSINMIKWLMGLGIIGQLVLAYLGLSK